jgi:glucose 1-dehydrogenase
MGAGELLKGQTTFVTGANSGIGEDIARAMAAAGAKVVINYVSNEDTALRIVLEPGG